MNNFFGGNKLLDTQFILKKANIIEGMLVGDFGCGLSGHFLFPTANLVGERGIVYAVDIRRSVLENIALNCETEGIKNIKLVWSNLEKFGATNIPANSLDVILLINVLFQIKKQIEALKESVRLLKKGSKVVVIDWKELKGGIGPKPEYRVKKNEIRAIMHGLGLEIVEDFEAGKYHFGLIFLK